MRFTVEYATNFARILRLPVNYPKGYCFGGGHPVQCQLVDWFNPIAQIDEEYRQIDFPKTIEGKELEQLHNDLRNFIRQKQYFIDYPNNKFLLITDYGDAFFI